MRKTIERSITVTRIYFSKIVVESGEVTAIPMASIEVTGRINNEKALKVIKETHGKDAQFVVRELEEKEERYEISVEDFMKYATKVEAEPQPADETPNPAPAE